MASEGPRPGAAPSFRLSAPISRASSASPTRSGAGRAAAPAATAERQEQQHPHRAGVEAVEQAEHEREQRQPEPGRAERAEQAAAKLGRRRRGAVEQRHDLRPGVLGILEADQHPAAGDEGRHPRRPGPRRLRQRDQLCARRRVAVHRPQHDVQPRALRRQPGEAGLGVGAVRATLAHVDHQFLRRGAGCIGAFDAGRGARRLTRLRRCRSPRSPGASRPRSGAAGARGWSARACS